MTKSKSWTLTALLLLVAAVRAPAAEPQKIYVPEGWEGAYGFGYAPVIRVGDQVIVSGIPAGGEGTYEEKIRRMYERARDLLEAAGASLDDVVELTTFHSEAKDSPRFREEFRLYMPIHREFFGEHRPAWTAVGTSALLSPTAPVEMRLVAIIGSGAEREVIRPQAQTEEAEEAEEAEEMEEKVGDGG